jgi:hypothetical protein
MGGRKIRIFGKKNFRVGITVKVSRNNMTSLSEGISWKKKRGGIFFFFFFLEELNKNNEKRKKIINNSIIRERKKEK